MGNQVYKQQIAILKEELDQMKMDLAELRRENAKLAMQLREAKKADKPATRFNLDAINKDES